LHPQNCRKETRPQSQVCGVAGKAKVVGVVGDPQSTVAKLTKNTTHVVEKIMLQQLEALQLNMTRGYDAQHHLAQTRVPQQ
jgi:hypothetical protein